MGYLVHGPEGKKGLVGAKLGASSTHHFLAKNVVLMKIYNFTATVVYHGAAWPEVLTCTCNGPFVYLSMAALHLKICQNSVGFNEKFSN